MISISIVIPTYNSIRTLEKCLESISIQDYPKERIELIIVDGGSNDDTLRIAERFKANKILRNPLRSGEAGKAIGVASSQNDLIAFIDSDNILPCKDWLSRMIEPFNDFGIVGSEPMYYTYRKEDPLISRYCSLIGMNDILCLFLGNYDRYCYLTGKWTNLKVNMTDMGDYVSVELDEKNIPTIGANGFIVRREIITQLEFQPYLFDIDIIHQMIKIGFNRFAKVKLGIVHLFASNTRGYTKKTLRRISEYCYYQRFGFRRYPWKTINFKGLQNFIISTLFLPILLKTIGVGFRKKTDVAWFYHIVASWLTLLTYGSVYLAYIRKRPKVQETVK